MRFKWQTSAVAGAIVVAAAVILGGTYRVRRPDVQAEGPPRDAEVEHIYSGHKVKLDTGEELVYAGIRAPHPGEEGFEEARRRNVELTEGRDVRLRFDSGAHNAKGQLQAYVTVSEGMVNEILVREGLAYVRLTPDSRRFAELLLAAQAEARTRQRGLWSKSRRTERRAELVADSKYGNFHLRTCEEVPKIKPERLVVFKTQNSAIEEGYAPCCKCQP